MYVVKKSRCIFFRAKSKSDGGRCNCRRTFAGILLLGVLVGVVGIGYFTYSLHKELRQLKSKFSSSKEGVFYVSHWVYFDIILYK